jgi:hypothetical protein
VRILFAMCTLFVGAVSDIVSSICCVNLLQSALL